MEDVKFILHFEKFNGHVELNYFSENLMLASVSLAKISP